MITTVHGEGGIRLTHGEWQEYFLNHPSMPADVLCTDPPYSGRTHEGQRTGSSTKASTIAYEPMTPEGAWELAAVFSAMVRHWAIIFADHISWRWHERAWRSVGWYTFAPVVWNKPDPPPRQQGDGPTNACEYILIARPIRAIEDGRKGHRRGEYRVRARIPKTEKVVAGQKPEELMRRLLGDYTRHGDKVLDPYAGSGTTLLVCREMERQAHGWERDTATIEAARKRLERAYQMRLL